VRSTGKHKIPLLNTCRQILRGVFIGHATWRPLLICFQLPYSHFLNPLLVIKARQAFTYPTTTFSISECQLRFAFPVPPSPRLTSDHQRGRQPPRGSTRVSTLTSPFGDPCVARVSAEGGQFGTGAGNETMLVTAISLATDATLLADDRQIVNLPAQRRLLQMQPCGRLTDIELFGHRHEVA
jgi:hypothetical protein